MLICKVLAKKMAGSYMKILKNAPELLLNKCVSHLGILNQGRPSRRNGCAGPYTYCRKFKIL